MTIKTEVNTAWEVRNNAWSGAIQTLNLMTDNEIEMVLNMLEDIYPEGMTETELNDFWWFETDLIAEQLGYNDFEEMWEDRQEA